MSTNQCQCKWHRRRHLLVSVAGVSFYLMAEHQEQPRDQSDSDTKSQVNDDKERQKLRQGWLKVTYNTGNPVFKYENIELLVCIYEISRELVFKYGISGCSRCLTLETIMNPLPSQIQPRQLFSSHLNHVSLYKLSVKGVSTYCRSWK